MSELHHHSLNRLRCDAVNQTTEAAGRGLTKDIDPAIIIGLALGHVRQGGQGSSSIPAPVMAGLDALADREDPTCRLVRNWINRRRTTSPPQAFNLTQHRYRDLTVSAEMISAATSSEVL